MRQVNDLCIKCQKRQIKVDKNGKGVYTYNVKNQLTGRKSEKAETYYSYDRQGNVMEATGTEGGICYSCKLVFDNKNLKDLYGKMKHGADQEEIARRINANYEFSMQNKENHPEKVESEGTCPNK